MFWVHILRTAVVSGSLSRRCTGTRLVEYLPLEEEFTPATLVSLRHFVQAPINHVLDIAESCFLFLKLNIETAWAQRNKLHSFGTSFL